MSDPAHGPRTRQRTALIAALVGLDAAAVAIALITAHRVASVFPVGRNPGPFPPSMLLMVPVAIALFALGKLYVLDEIMEGSVEYGRVVNGCTLASLSLVMLAFGAKAGELAPSRALIALVWAASILLVGSDRFLARRVVRFLRRRGILVSRAVIVGLGTAGLAYAKQFEQMPAAGIKVVGFVDDFLPPGTPVVDGLRVLGPPSALPAILSAEDAQEVIIVPTAMAWESFQQLIRQVAGMNGHVIRLAPGSRDLLTTHMKVHQLGFIPMMTVERVRIVGFDRVLKAAMDYVMAGVGLVLALPFIALAAAALRASGQRALLRRLPYVGPRGTVLTTFLLDTSGLSGRPAAFARFLGLERAPQMMSVLRGQMSIVGPQPISPDQRQTREPWLHALLAVKPGLTGMWAFRRSAPLDDEMEQSLFYIRNYTIWRDLEVLFRSALRRFELRAERDKAGTGPTEREGGVGGRVPVHR